MRNVAISVGILVLVLIVWVATRKPLSIDEELGKLPSDERQALDALAAAAGVTAAQLRPVGPGVLEYNPKAVAIQDGHVVELRIADASLRQIEPVAKFSALRTLWLDGNPIGSLAPLSGLKALRTLNLSRCQIGQVSDLRELPALVSLDLTGNRVEDVSPLVALAALENINLSGNPIKAMPPSAPARWKVKSDMPTAPAEAKAAPTVAKPDNWVDETPKTSGQSKTGTMEGLVTNTSYNVKGTIAWISGAVLIPNIPGIPQASGGNTTLHLEVQKGKVRAYLESSIPDKSTLTGLKTGFIYAEATPGKPGEIVGSLRSYGGAYGKNKAYQLVVESLDGEAEGVSYSLSRK